MFDIFKFVFRNEGSAASVSVTEKEDSRVAVSPNKSSSSSPAVSPKKKPRLSQTLSSSSASESDRDKDKRQTEASSSSSKSSVTVTPSPKRAKTKSKNRLIKLTLTEQQLADVEHESEGAESTQRIRENLNSCLRSSPADMFDKENETDGFQNLNWNPKVTVEKVKLDQHFQMDVPDSHANPTFTLATDKNILTPLTLPPLSLPVTERVTTSKSGGGGQEGGPNRKLVILQVLQPILVLQEIQLWCRRLHCLHITLTLVSLVQKVLVLIVVTVYVLVLVLRQV